MENIFDIKTSSILHMGAQVDCVQKKIADCSVDSFEYAPI
jgi:hypothetical protein